MDAPKKPRRKRHKSTEQRNRVSRARAREEKPDPIAAMQANAERDAKKARVVELVETESLTFSGAAKRIGIGRTTLHRWRQDDPAFDAALKEAYEAGTDTLEDKLTERAKAGSDHLLLEAVRSRRPAWRNPKYHVPPQIGHPASGGVRDLLPMLSPRLLDEIEAELERAQAADAKAPG